MKVQLATVLLLTTACFSAGANESVDAADIPIYQLFSSKTPRHGRCIQKGARYPGPGDNCEAEVAATKAIGWDAKFAFAYDGQGRMYCEMPDAGLSCARPAKTRVDQKVHRRK